MAAQSSDRDESGSNSTNAATPNASANADTEPTSTESTKSPATGSGTVASRGPSEKADPAENTGGAEVARAHQFSPALIATAVALPVALVVAVLIVAIFANNAPVERDPLALGPVPAPAAEGPGCAALLPALPAELGDLTTSTLVAPAPPATRAWQPESGGDAVVLRCGLDRPLEFNRASPLQLIDGVQWFEIRDDTAKASTWVAVDRGTYLAVTAPDGTGPTPLQTISDTVAATLPAQPIDPGPLPN